MTVMCSESQRDNPIKYAAAFQKVGEELPLWYRGGRITLFHDSFVLSILGIKRIEVPYKEILKIEKERYCLYDCIAVHCAKYRVYIHVSASNTDKLFDELQRRKRVIWKD